MTGIIGKKHVAPDNVYPFQYSYTEENFPINQIGRNITLIKTIAYNFLAQAKWTNSSFFLYIGFHDPHRCGSTNPKYGAFCEKLGDGKSGQGVIPDWHPVEYDPADVEVPYFVQDTPAARSDLAAQYKTISRLDQGVGLLMKGLKEFGHDSNTLVIYTSDNGIPFPNGRTNLYDSGMAEPMLVSNPFVEQRWGQSSDAMVSLTDIVPTVLDWFSLPYPKYTLFGPNSVTLQGKSLLPLLVSDPTQGWDRVFASHNLHEITMYYPMRVVRTKQYKLIHNLNYRMPFMIDQDFYASNTFQDLLNRTMNDVPTHWFKTLDSYYYRSEWELYDIIADPSETSNLAGEDKYHTVLGELMKELTDWQRVTNDPWICSPSGVFENKGNFPSSGVCLPLHNGL